MAITLECPECGNPMPADAPLGLCPRCVLKMGMDDGIEPTVSHTPPPSLGPQATPTPDALARLFPQLEILRPIGRGGMGVVYQARQVKLDRLVALKVIRPEAANDPNFAERFAREARAMARLNHPNIVTVHDFGEAEGVYYLVMEWVGGHDLRSALHGGKLGVKPATMTALQLCDALEYAHAQGVIHRDIKPENILLDAQGRPKLADFGLAKLVQPTAGESPLTLTQTRHVMGTPHYMAPEQLERPREVDARADIYSLGVVLYEMLMGTLPFGRYDLPSEKLSLSDDSIDTILTMALERNPASRYPRVADMRAALAEFAEAELELTGPLAWSPTAAPAEPDGNNAEAQAMGWGCLLLFLLLVGGGFPLIGGLSSYSEKLTNRLPEGWARDLGHLGRYAAALLVLMAVFGVISLKSFRMKLPWARPAAEGTSLSPGLDAARRKVAGPGMVLIFLGIINCLTLPALGLLRSSWRDLFLPLDNMIPPIGYLFIGLLSVATGPLILLAGVKMRALEEREFAVAGSILAMIPLTPAGVLGTLPGVWALAVLTDSRVIAAFRRAREESALELSAPPAPPTDSAIAGGTRYGAPPEK